MIEVEIKLRVNDVEGLKHRLDRLNATYNGEKQQWDIYFNSPFRDFSRSGETLRLRQIGAGSEAILTYKGPPSYRKGSKARREVESTIEGQVENIERHRDILEVLGFQPFAEINKRRLRYALGDTPVYLDEVEQLGSFVEIGTAVPEADAAAMERRIFEIADQLGLEEDQVVQETYLDLLLGREPSSNP